MEKYVKFKGHSTYYCIVKLEHNWHQVTHLIPDDKVADEHMIVTALPGREHIAVSGAVVLYDDIERAMYSYDHDAKVGLPVTRLAVLTNGIDLACLPTRSVAIKVSRRRMQLKPTTYVSEE